MSKEVNNSPRIPVPTAAPIKPYSDATKQLQIEINKAIDEGKLPGPKLKPDGLEGPKTRARIADFQAMQEAAAKAAAPKPDQAPPKKDPTVGEYVEQQVAAAGKELKEDAQVVAITAVAAPVVAVIEARHLNQARERIAKLPMDPEGKWKGEADKILKEENAAAKAEILHLPGAVAQGVSDGAHAVAHGVSVGAHAVANGVSEGYHAANEWAGKQIDAGVQAAEHAWGAVASGSGAALAWAKEAVPKAFHTVAEDAGVAAIALNPLGAIPSAQIMANHMASAYDRIMKLPMDPEGKWKQQAAKIVDEEQGKAKQEILGLPGKAYHAVADTATAIYTGARDGVVHAGHWVADTTVAGAHAVAHGASVAANAVADTAVAGYNVAAEGVHEARHGVGGLIERFGKWIAGN